MVSPETLEFHDVTNDPNNHNLTTAILDAAADDLAAYRGQYIMAADFVDVISKFWHFRFPEMLKH